MPGQLFSFGKWNSYCSEKPLKFGNKQSRESGCNTAHQSWAETLSCSCSVREVDQDYPQTWYLGTSPLIWRAWFMSQKRLQAHLHTLNLAGGLWPWHCPYLPQPKVGDWVLLAMTLLWDFVLGWDPYHLPKSRQWTPSGGFSFQKSRHPLEPMSGRGVSSTNQTDLDEKMHNKEPDCFWRSKKDESVNFCSKWEAEL